MASVHLFGARDFKKSASFAILLVINRKERNSEMKKHLISAISIVSAVSALLFLAGLWMVFEDQQTKATGVKTETARTGKNTSKADGTKQITITAIGDSLTRGTGDTAGKGYAGYVADRLKKKRRRLFCSKTMVSKGLLQAGCLNRSNSRKSNANSGMRISFC